MRAAALALLVLAACAPVPVAQAPERGLSLVPAADGLDVAPTGRQIGFGRHRDGAVAAAARVLGNRPGTSAACDGGRLTAVNWPGEGLTMYFAGRDSAFVGWRAGAGRTFDGAVRAAGQVCP